MKRGSTTLIQGPIGTTFSIGPPWIWMQPALPTKTITGIAASAAWCRVCAIALDGGLAAVTVLQSSGNAAFDQIALDHIRRSAPFRAPPTDARPGYSFEFVGK